MPRLTLQQSLLALVMIRAGRTHREAAQHFNCHLNIVDRLVQRYAQHNDVRDPPRSGRPRFTTPAQDRYTRVVHLRNRLQTARKIARNIPNLRRINQQTVINRLREYGLRPRRPVIRPILKLRHRQARLQWCRHHFRHPLLWWRRVLFTDDCCIHLSWCFHEVNETCLFCIVLFWRTHFLFGRLY
jgi:transposase